MGDCEYPSLKSLLSSLGLRNYSSYSILLSSLDTLKESIARSSFGQTSFYDSKLMVIQPMFAKTFSLFPSLFASLDLVFLILCVLCFVQFRSIASKATHGLIATIAFAINPYVYYSVIEHDLLLFEFLLALTFVRESMASAASKPKLYFSFGLLVYLCPQAILLSSVYLYHHGRSTKEVLSLFGTGLLLIAGLLLLNLTMNDFNWNFIRSCYYDVLHCTAFMNFDGFVCEIIFNTFNEFIPVMMSMLAVLPLFLTFPTFHYFSRLRARVKPQHAPQLFNLMLSFIFMALHLLVPYQNNLYQTFALVFLCLSAELALNKLSLTLVAYMIVSKTVLAITMHTYAEYSFYESTYVNMMNYIVYLGNSLVFLLTFSRLELDPRPEEPSTEDQSRVTPHGSPQK